MRQEQVRPGIPQLFPRNFEVKPTCGGVETGEIGWKVGCAVFRDGCAVWRRVRYPHPDATILLTVALSNEREKNTCRQRTHTASAIFPNIAWKSLEQWEQQPLLCP